MSTNPVLTSSRLDIRSPVGQEEPIKRHGLCGLAQPCLKNRVHTPVFRFFEATLLLVVSGRFDFKDSHHRITIEPSASLCLVEQNTCGDILKTPDGPDKRFRSIFITLTNRERFDCSPSKIR